MSSGPHLLLSLLVLERLFIDDLTRPRRHGYSHGGGAVLPGVRPSALFGECILAHRSSGSHFVLQKVLESHIDNNVDSNDPKDTDIAIPNNNNDNNIVIHDNT
ncbi:hypothetical protein ONE63_011486 [Megalurothrips usitatus]|uniref:Secreted protein n=1 Tax=Megalurothrips usitatus TaxID=439358 RepID=A0AAV7X1R1_9NEOP|nr:hypothetical protein ONE63_011486 [Megalurothrips usitatus]